MGLQTAAVAQAHGEGGEAEGDPTADIMANRDVESGVQRAQLLVKNQAERERIRKTATRIRVSIKAVKHLPKMDKFGKTDA